MRVSARHWRRIALVVAAMAGALVAGPAAAQDGFRITYDVDRARADRARVTGRVVNERPDDVFEVNVTAEALDAKGKVLARGITFVDSRISRGDARPFSLSVPTVPGTANFRVGVSSFRAGFSSQGP
jgi:ABC-type sugar transport system substrate-binding protein